MTPREPIETPGLEDTLKTRTMEQVVDLLLNDLRELPADLKNLTTTLQDLTRRFEEHQAICGTRFQGISDDITNRLASAQASLETAAKLAAEHAVQIAAAPAAQAAAREAVQEKLSAAEAEVRATGAKLVADWSPAALDQRIEDRTKQLKWLAAAGLLVGAFLLSMHYENISLGKLLAFIWLSIKAYGGM